MDAEQVDRERRGRRIFDALRRGRGNEDTGEAPDTPETPDAPGADEASESAPESAEAPEGEAGTDSGNSEGNGRLESAAEPATVSVEEESDGADPAFDHGPHTADGPSAGEPSAHESATSEAGDRSGDAEVPLEDESEGTDGGPLPGIGELAAQLQTGTHASPQAPPAEDAPAGSSATLEHDDEPGTATATVEGDSGVPAPEGLAPEDAAADAVSLPRVIAIANQKGGVGKTTTAVNLSAALTELGFRVLVIDLDPQGNATTGLGIDIRNLESTVYDSLMSDVPLEDCVEPTSVRNLFVAPSNMDLAGAEIELVPMFSRELKLRRAVETVKADYDYVLIDCPPSLGLLTINGLAAADDVVVPIQCEYYALEGLGQLVNNVNLVRANLNPVLDVRGIVLTMYDARTKLADQVVQEVREHFGSRVYETVVPRTVRLSEAPSFGQPIIVFDSASRGSDAYRALAKEVSRGAQPRTA